MDLQRIKLELHKVSFVTAASEQRRLDQSELFTHGMEKQQTMLNTRLDQHHEDVSQRIKELERLILSQGQADLGTSSSKVSSDLAKTTGGTLSAIEAVKVTLCQSAYCNTWCPCICHKKQKVEVAGRGIVEKMVGKLFVGYSGVPYISKSCDFRGCLHQKGTKVNVEYWFPWWFLAMNVKLSMQSLPGLGPEMQLTTAYRIPDSAPAITYVMSNDIEGLKYLFSNGLASPRDVSDSRGFSLMRVSKISFKPWVSRLTNVLVGTLWRMALGGSPISDQSGSIRG